MTNQRIIPKSFSEVRERAVRMVLKHRADHSSQWGAIASIVAKIGRTGVALGARGLRLGCPGAGSA